MTDIVEQLRIGAVEAFALPVATVMDSAADEIERLRLTAAERDAVDAAILFMESRGVMGWAATMRGLLERTK